MDATLESLSTAQADAAYHAGVIAAIDGLPFSAPEGAALRFYQAGWDDGIVASQVWAPEAVD